MFSFTRQERQVIVFLLIIGLLGAGIDFLVKRNMAPKSLAIFDETIGKIDLNKADEETLIDIPGIGEKLAARIVEYRLQQGGFKSLEDACSIKGLTRNRCAKIREFCFVQ